MINFYNKLIKKYGYQGWWPVTPTNSLDGKPKYGVKVATNKQRLEISFGAILTQNTSWKNVEKAIVELNKEELIDIDKIINIKHEKLAKIIRSSGYYNQKAIKLKAFCSFLKLHSFNDLLKMDLYETRELLLKIKGIGKETADSILLYALNKPIFVVDTYTKRFLGKTQCDYDCIQNLFMESLPKDVNLFKEFHALIVREGKKH